MDTYTTKRLTMHKDRREISIRASLEGSAKLTKKVSHKSQLPILEFAVKEISYFEAVFRNSVLMFSV